MPQKTNLNISPYFDDFDKDDNFYRVLFKPGFPVQARELTTLQSMLQNQIESFGSHIFKEGSMVIPGNINYDGEYTCIKINTDHLGIDIINYADQLVGKRLRGQTSGVVASVDKYLDISPAEGVTEFTLFVRYHQAGTSEEVSTFSDGEVLITEESFAYGNTNINAGDTVTTVVSENASAIGSNVSIGNGVYFIRGTFVDVAEDKLVLDPYANTPSYRVGLNISEELITAKDDSSLYDNAKGFSNFAAPGADRLKISTTLTKKLLTDFDDKNFVELLRIENGEIKKLQNTSVYSIIKDYFAKRTYEESGDYSLGNFGVQIAESLNNRLSNDGVYFEGQVTDQLNTPSEDLLAVKVSPGKAYVRGFDVETVSTTVLDVEKPRDTRTVNNSLVPFEFGTLFKVNFAAGTPFIGVNNNSNTVELYNRRKATQFASAGSGTKIGEARIYAYNLTDAPYVDNTSEFDLYLFDVQTYTEIVVNESLNSTQCPATSFVEGVSSGASGFVVTAASSATIMLTQTSGTFIAGEQLRINGTTEVSRSVRTVKTFGIQDVKSVYQDSTSVSSELKSDFSGDLVLQKKTATNFSLTDTITISTAGIATVPGKNFVGIKSDAIIRYQTSDLAAETFNRVESVSSDGLTLTLAATTDVANVCDGNLPSTTQTVSFSIGAPIVKEKGGLYAHLEEDNVSSVGLSGSNLTVIKQIREKSTDATGQLGLTPSETGITSSRYETFDADRYTVVYSNGGYEALSSDQFTLGTDGNITITGLNASQSSNVTVNTTVRKIGIKEKQKEYVRSEKVNITKTSAGVSTTFTGLSTSPYYGTRIEDREVCLNLPDVVKVIGVFESLNASTPVLDSLEFPSGLSLDTSSILGEKILGKDSGALAQIVTRSSATKVEIVRLNDAEFVLGEAVTFQESNIQSAIATINKGNYQNVTSHYKLDSAQREQYYDYSRIVRKNDGYIPSRRLLVIFDYYRVPSNDLGDVYTVNSYDSERYKYDIPVLPSGIRASDVLDFRPRVAQFSSETSSPFAFASRTFATAGTNPTLVVAPLEGSIVDYSHYLPRIDKVSLDKEGNFSVTKGVSAVNPKPPSNVDSAMEIATIELPAYLYDVKDAKITITDNRRYTMRDIGKIEDRVETLETLTSLSLLELDTKSLQVRDADGFDRFKSGFFVDDFKDTARLDFGESEVNVDTANNELTTPIDFYSLKPQVALEPSINLDTADFTQNLQLLDSNVQKTGDLITLKYTEKTWIEQPLASRVENVNPFNMIDFTGRIELSPASDNWVRNVFVDGGERSIVGDFNGSYIETIKISSNPDTHIRSRNVSFAAGGLRPLARHYQFFDSASGIDIVPKLIEVTMSSGVFSVGENVQGFINGNRSSGGTRIFRARAIQPNHKTGPYNNPTTTISLNPYDRSLTLPTTYSASSTVLNIDSEALSDEVQGKYFGYVTKGMVLVGETSGAEATVSDVRLVTDTFGDLGGSFFFRDPLSSPPPPLRFETGTRTFKLTSSSTNAKPLPGSLLISSGETTYTTSGIVDTFRQTRVIVRRPPPPPPAPPQNRGGGKDPLAQSFTVDETGAFLTAVDLFFANKDENEKVTIEVRTVELGTPTDQLVDDFSRVTLEPSQVNTSSDGTVATKVTFPSPIYLEPSKEYAIVILAPTTNNYETWIARMGERTVNTTTLPNAESVIVTKQYVGGSLFKSQNGTIWTASQFEDLKFKLYKANFSTTPGTAYFYNTPLTTIDANLPKLTLDPIKTLPRKLKVGITTTTTMNAVLQVGRKVSDGTVGRPYGYIEQVGGRLNTASVTSVGAGYSTGSFADIPLYTITGSGSGARGTVVVTANKLSSVSITTPGNGYVVGDLVGVTTSSVIKGSGGRVSVTTLDGNDTLYLTNVQGEEFTASTDLVVYGGSTAVSYANTDILSSSVVNSLYEGNVVEMNQYGHGMHATNNIVTLSDIEPNTVPSTLSADLSIGSASISVANTSIFGTFEGISTSRGFVKINNEVIFYDSITAAGGGSGTLGIGTRGIDGSLVRSHPTNSQIFPYELNGVSLTKINKQHNMSANALLNSSQDLDKYYIQIDRQDRASGDTQLSFTDENYVGGKDVIATKNIQYNTLLPRVNFITPGDGTNVSAQIRTVSGTSAGGSEPSFIDQGFESIELNEQNELSSTRIVASEVNESNRLTDLPKNRSFTLGVTLNSADSNLSPVIDTANMTMIYGRNRLNDPVSDYAFDGRVNLNSEDPHTAVYVTNKISLKQPASSLKVLVGSYRHSSADFRVLYQLFRTDSNEVEQAFELFPGYDNLRDTNNDGFGDTVIDNTKNSGRADAFVVASADGQFSEYQFSIDDLEQFNGFRIKIVMSGTNEARSPKFKDLRVIALA